MLSIVEILRGLLSLSPELPAASSAAPLPNQSGSVITRQTPVTDHIVGKTTQLRKPTHAATAPPQGFGALDATTSDPELDAALKPWRKSVAHVAAIDKYRRVRFSTPPPILIAVSPGSAEEDALEGEGWSAFPSTILRPLPAALRPMTTSTLSPSFPSSDLEPTGWLGLAPFRPPVLQPILRNAERFSANSSSIILAETACELCTTEMGVIELLGCEDTVCGECLERVVRRALRARKNPRCPVCVTYLGDNPAAQLPCELEIVDVEAGEI